MKMARRRATPRQLANLARGREILFQKQLKQKGINLNPKPQIIREVIKQPIVTHSTTHVHPIKVQLSLFDKFLQTKFFPIEINNNKEILNIKELIKYIVARLNIHWKNISSNKKNIGRIINYINSKDKEYGDKFIKMEKRISDLEEENKKLRAKDDTTNTN